MEFKFSKEEEAFRQEIRDFLKKNPPDSFPKQQEDDAYGFGGWSNEFWRVMGSKGWISLLWPKEYGGSARPLMEFLILLDELAYAGAPTMAGFMALPEGRTIIEMGNDTLKKELLPKIAKGEITFWLALSEPGAGSDLLALETRAVEEGDYYVINGQKVWSSYAHLADYALLITRTDPNVPRHKGLSMFILDKKLPGVTVRPLISLAGNHVHNEIFMDNVRVPKTYLLGQKNQGFYQMLKTLEVDRFWGRFIKPPLCKGILEEIVQYANETSRDGAILARDPAVRYKLAESAIEIEACRLLFYHAGWKMQKGLPLVYEASLPKILADEMGQRLFTKAMQIMGPYSQLGEATKWAPLRGKINRWYMFSTGHTLAGGSSEINRTTIATVGMGLPRG